MAKRLEVGASARLTQAGGALLLAFFASVSVLSAHAADDFEAWMRGQQTEAQAVQQQFQTYRSEQDRQFSDYLKAQWKEFQVFKGAVRDPKPKPVNPPIAPPVATPKPRAQAMPPLPATPPDTPAPRLAQPSRPSQPSPPSQPLTPVAPPPAPPVALKPPPAPQPPIAPPPPKPKPAEDGAPRASVDFFGNRLQLPYDTQWRTLNVQAVDPKGLAAFWDKVSATRFQPTLDAVARARAQLRLDDWGHAVLWRDFAQTLHARATEQNLLLWFFLVKSGVDVRLGYSGQDVHLFVAVQQPVYATSFIKVGKRTYYALMSADRGSSLKRFSTYQANYPAPLKAMDLKGAAIDFTRAQAANRNVSFQHRGKPVQFSVSYDRHLIDYMAGFPQMDFDLYFATQASPVARPPLLQALHAQMRGMSEEEAVNYLLAFVQKAFAYKTDQEQFGYEKYFFVEEALHYPFSDCEDRSALFSWLVRELLGLKTVGLHYPGHMTTGVAMKTARPGWHTVDWQGQRYVIADPTYINADVGMAMPSYAGQKPIRVIP